MEVTDLQGFYHLFFPLSLAKLKPLPLNMFPFQYISFDYSTQKFLNNFGLKWNTKQEGFLLCQTPTSTVRMKVEGCRVKKSISSYCPFVAI
jgi:hypothetical protein